MWFPTLSYHKGSHRFRIHTLHSQLLDKTVFLFSWNHVISQTALASAYLDPGRPLPILLSNEVLFFSG